MLCQLRIHELGGFAGMAEPHHVAELVEQDTAPGDARPEASGELPSGGPVEDDVGVELEEATDQGVADALRPTPSGDDDVVASGVRALAGPERRPVDEDRGPAFPVAFRLVGRPPDVERLVGGAVVDEGDAGGFPTRAKASWTSATAPGGASSSLTT